MFYKCSSLKEINFKDFNIYKVKNKEDMFKGCSDELKNSIKKKCPNLLN